MKSLERAALATFCFAKVLNRPYDRPLWSLIERSANSVGDDPGLRSNPARSSRRQGQTMEQRAAGPAAPTFELPVYHCRKPVRS